MTISRARAKGFGKSVSDVETHMEWRLKAATCTKTEGNPFGLDESLLEETVELAPPLHELDEWSIPEEEYEYHGRHLIHDDFVRYAPKEQPRRNSNEPDHVNKLVNDFQVNEYRKDSQPPIAVPDTESLDAVDIKGLSGYHRKAARNNLPLKQKLYFYDLYSFSSPKWERVARNISNHPGAPQLSQTKGDYVSEVVNAVRDNIIEGNSDSIDEFVDLIAADRTSHTRKDIKKVSYKNCDIYPNFTTYNSQGNGVGSIQRFISNELKLPKMGFEGRTKNNAAEIKKQGYIIYAANCGDVLRGWGSGINKAMRWGIPIWLLGYSSERVDDLPAWRESFIEEFVGYKETMIQFAYQTSRNWVSEDCLTDYNSLSLDDLVESVDEDLFPVKLAGFFPQHTSRNAKDGGRSTERGLVDVQGRTIKFNPNGDCLTTLTQP
jgi:hypothetical protein|tara:strand:- start:51 stop:1352 length:1302 start_codon:yes stop_codon:yes gene_type:complete